MQTENILKILPRQIKQYLLSQKVVIHHVQEMKLRTNKPLNVICNFGEKVFDYIVTKEDIREVVGYISRYSLYAYEEEMKQGFITIEGGHRVGLSGQAIIENGKVKNIKYISSINIRMSHEILGCADKVFPYIIKEGQLYHTLIVSPPGCGKTTLLRDMIRQISDGNSYIKGKTVGVVDERSEIGGCYMGVAQNQLGIRTDILDRCPKAEGMIMLIRSMNPEVIAVDEIGMAEDVRSIDYAMNCGCKMLATVHGRTIEEIQNKPVLGKMVADKRFKRYIVLGHAKTAGDVIGIYDECGTEVGVW